MNSKKSIAVYGLSTETDKELPNLLAEYNIVGLLDGFKTDGELYGQPIISMEAAIELRITKIIVVARPGSCKAISKRIGNICRENNIELFDIRGNDLLENNRVVYDFKSLNGYKKANLIQAIQKADVVSFDMFDTLIIRSIPLNTDVIELAEYRLQEAGIKVDDFVKRRIEAEKILSQKYAPRLIDIYRKAFPDVDENILREMISIEYLTDSSLITARKDMLEIIQTAKSLGKKICITSDCYYSSEQLVKILHDNSICGYDALFVSCEYGKSKSCGLYEILKEYSEGKSILHIGDDSLADIKYASEAGISTFEIYSGMELFDALGGLSMEESVDSISDKLRVGLFISKILNSPFQFENDECRLKIETAHEIGYELCAPMLNDFALWFGDITEAYKCTNRWFSARDGYLLQKIFSIIFPDKSSEYYYTSRTSAIRAGVENEDDIRYIDSMKFSGTVKEMLQKRFGISIDDCSDCVNCEDGLMRYSDVILKSAQQKRANNLEYIQSLELKDGPVAFFDFVAKGTSQMYVEKLVDNPIVGFYFLQLEPEFMKDKGLKIYPFYSEIERAGSSIFNDYYILETILTSPEASVEEFDNNGKPVFADESRCEEDIRCIMEIQEGILDNIAKYISICPNGCYKINKQLDEKFLNLIHNVDIADKAFLNITVEDPFFNRMTDIKDLL